MTAPDTTEAGRPETERKRLTPAEVFDVVADQEDDVEGIRNLARAIGSCALAGDHVGFDARESTCRAFTTAALAGGRIEPG